MPSGARRVHHHCRVHHHAGGTRPGEAGPARPPPRAPGARPGGDESIPSTKAVSLARELDGATNYRAAKRLLREQAGRDEGLRRSQAKIKVIGLSGRACVETLMPVCTICMHMS